jgi:hypothetical protein
MNPRTWDMARAICEAEGGHLAIIKGKKEERHLVGILNSPEFKASHVRNTNVVLIGFHKQYAKDYFVTVKGINQFFTLLTLD